MVQLKTRVIGGAWSLLALRAAAQYATASDECMARAPSKTMLDEYDIAPMNASARDNWYSCVYVNGSVSATIDSAVAPHAGSNALRLEYTAEHTQSWGGYVDVGHVKASGFHDCTSAIYISFWYNNIQKQSAATRAHLRLILLDGSDCNASAVPCSTVAPKEGESMPNPGEHLEHWYSHNLILDDTPGWKEHIVPLSEFILHGWTGKTGNERLDKDKLMGYRWEVSMDSSGNLSSQTSGVILLDHLGCFPEDEVRMETGPHVLMVDDMEDAGGKANVEAVIYADSGTNNVSWVTDDVRQGEKALKWTYEAVMTQSWGGFVSYTHMLPNSSTSLYNCSGANQVAFWYKILKRQSNPGRAHLRLILQDSSHCDPNTVDCGNPNGQKVEAWYSHHYLLEDRPDAWLLKKVPSNEFIRHGWAGVVGNDALDLDKLRGYRFEISIDSNGDMGSSTAGELLLDQVECLAADTLATKKVQDELVIDGFDHADVSSRFPFFYERIYATPAGSMTRNFVTSGQYSGFGALELEYTVVHTQSWGGYLDFGHVHDSGFYNCKNADYLSFWYNVVTKQSAPGRAHLRLILMEGSDCSGLCSSFANGDEAAGAFENWYSHHLILDDEPGWKEMQIPVDALIWRDWTGVTGNGKWDGDRLRGWRFEVSINSDGDTNSSSSGKILLDQLGCVGKGMLGGSLQLASWAEAEGNYSFEKMVAGNATSALVQSELLFSDPSARVVNRSMATAMYSVLSTGSGGTTSWMHMLPHSAYYNLSLSRDQRNWTDMNMPSMKLFYQNLQKQSATGEAHLRLALHDGWNCRASPGTQCTSTGALETWSASYNVLDDPTGAWDFRSTKLVGGASMSGGMERLNGAGTDGNLEFDGDYIKGYALEFVSKADSSGQILLDDFSVVRPCGDEAKTAALKCESLENVLFEDTTFNETTGVGFKRLEFAASTCCTECLNEPTCNFWYEDNRDCFMAQYARKVSVKKAGRYDSIFQMGISNTEAKRGKACGSGGLCDCTQDNIDCSNRDLVLVPILPESFSQLTSRRLAPRQLSTKKTLDLSGNKALRILTSVMVGPLAGELEEINLAGTAVTFLEGQILMGFPNLGISMPSSTEIATAYAIMDGKPAPELGAMPFQYGSVATSTQKRFSDSCCVPDPAVSGKVDPTTNASLFYCKQVPAIPLGEDCIYEDYYVYFHGYDIEINRGSDEGIKKHYTVDWHSCAELCKLNRWCNFFMWDGRWKNAANLCHIKDTDAGRKYQREIADDYSTQVGDANHPQPGYVSGWCPQTRANADKFPGYGNARVVMTPISDPVSKTPIAEADLVAHEANNYTVYFTVTLMSAPLRGSVFLDPSIVGVTGVSATFSPESIVFYPGEWNQVFTMQAKILTMPTATKQNRAPRLPVSVLLEGDACDDAFKSAVQPAEYRTLTLTAAYYYVSCDVWTDYRDPVSKSCKPCAGDGFQSRSGLECVNILPQYRAAADAPNSCREGFRATADNDGTCESCPTGFKAIAMSGSAGRMIWDCVISCPAGRAQNMPHIEECKACLPGTANNKSGEPKCTDCAAGTYTDAAGSLSCTACSPGSSTNDMTGAKACFACPTGQFVEVPGQASCTLCPLGTYQNDTGATQCKSCGDGRITLAVGAKSASDCVCPGGSYLSHKSGSCVPCGDGLACPGGSDLSNHLNGDMAFGGQSPMAMSVKPGFVLPSLSEPLQVYACDSLSTSISEVSVPELVEFLQARCPGGDFNTCGANRHGVACGECLPDHYEDSEGRCFKCQDGEGVLLPLAMVLVLTLVVVAYYLANTPMTANLTGQSALVTSFGTFISMIQTLSVLEKITIQWPPAIAGPMSSIALFAMDLRPLKGACLTGTSAISSYFFSAFGLVILLAILFVISFLTRLVLPRSSRWRMHLPETCNVSGMCFQAMFITVLFGVIKPFDCYRHPNGEKSVRSFPHILCGKEDHTGMVVIAVFAMVPLIMFASMVIYYTVMAPSLSLQSNHFWKPVKFLLYRFHPASWWWGSFFMCRSILVAITSLIEGQPLIQLVMLVVVLEVYVISLCVAWPWKTKGLNLCDLIMTTAVMFMVLTGLVFLDTKNLDTAEGRQAVNFAILSLTVAVVALAVYSANILYKMLAAWRAKGLEKSEKDNEEQMKPWLYDIDTWRWILRLSSDRLSRKDWVEFYQRISSIDRSRLRAAITVLVFELFKDGGPELLEMNNKLTRMGRRLRSSAVGGSKDSPIRTSLSGQPSREEVATEEPLNEKPLSLGSWSLAGDPTSVAQQDVDGLKRKDKQSVRI